MQRPCWRLRSRRWHKLWDRCRKDGSRLLLRKAKCTSSITTQGKRRGSIPACVNIATFFTKLFEILFSILSEFTLPLSPPSPSPSPLAPPSPPSSSPPTPPTPNPETEILSWLNDGGCILERFQKQFEIFRIFLWNSSRASSQDSSKVLSCLLSLDSLKSPNQYALKLIALAREINEFPFFFLLL